MKLLTKSLLAGAVLGLSIPAFAMPTHSMVYNLKQAEKACPATDSLMYHAVNQYKGTVTASTNNNTFKSVGQVLRPSNIEVNAKTGKISPVSMRYSWNDSGYAIESGGTITCNYLYGAYNGAGVPLVMKSQ